MARFRVFCLGVGDAFSARWYSSCLALEADGTWLLVDCPHPIRKILRESSEAARTPLDVDQIAGVVLTHLHADHVSGLEGFAFYTHFTLARRTIVLAHPDVADELWDAHRVGMSRVAMPDSKRLESICEDFFEIHLLDDARPVAFGPFMIACRRTLHPIPTFALRIVAAGRALGLSADTSFDLDLIDWLAEADLIIHETNRGLHTPYQSLAALPEPLRRKMRLIHYPDDFDTAASVIEPLASGRIYEV